MSGFRIAPYYEIRHDRSLGLQDVPINTLSDSAQLFVVLHGGYCMGYWWKRGDVIVCETSKRSNAGVVLVPRGYGWPRLGFRYGAGELKGDAGEPCRSERWVVAGNITDLFRKSECGVWQQLAVGPALESPTDKVVHNWERSASAEQRTSSNRPVQEVRSIRPTNSQQLSLFTTAVLAA